MALLAKPWLIFWPFSESLLTGRGQGMSYHGGFVGCFLDLLVDKAAQAGFFCLGDTAAVGYRLRLHFGRIGNFLNGELYGRITTSKIARVSSVPLQTAFRSKKMVREFAAKAGIAVQEGAQYVNLPRHRYTGVA